MKCFLCSATTWPSCWFEGLDWLPHHVASVFSITSRVRIPCIEQRPQRVTLLILMCTMVMAPRSCRHMRSQIRSFSSVSTCMIILQELAGLVSGASQYEFYPGTGSQDRLEHNVVNAAMVPMWRKERGRGNEGNKSRGKKGRGSGAVRARRRRLTRPLRRAGRSNFRQTISDRLVPALRAFNPELILLSSGFDGANGDVGNCLKTGARGNDTPGIDLEPSDFFWATKQIQEVAAVCCEGRIVSVLEGGYGVNRRTTPISWTR